jgi:hypothetical protein
MVFIIQFGMMHLTAYGDLMPVSAEYSATLCDLGVFMDEPAEPISSDDLDVGVDGVG